MTKVSPSKPEGRKGVNPEWANLPRRKCDNDGKWYKPFRPLKPKERGFCCDNCRKAYHKHGGAYQKLKTEIGKEITHQLRLIEPCEVCNGKGIVSGMRGRKPHIDAEFKCGNLLCREGKTLTEYGRQVLRIVQRFSDFPLPL